MGVPSNISKVHIDKAIIEIQKKEIPNERKSIHYFLKVGNIELPPKYVLSIANKYANNEELLSKDFQAVEAKSFLKKLNYNVIVKNNQDKHVEAGFYGQLIMFLDQTKTTNLKYNQYIKKYLGLKVRVSFGQGNIARIPWISFLGENQSTDNGIYPVYLYYKEYNELILAYGISETNPPKLHWNIPEGTLTIKNYYKQKGKTPARYGDSYVFKSYSVDEFDPDQIEEDLHSIVFEYKQIFNNSTLNLNTQSVLSNNASFDIDIFLNEVKNSGLIFDEKIIKRYTYSLLTKPFVILTGLSGSGKTKLAQIFTKWICENDTQYKIIPVGADWTNREPLLGYPNALECGKYVMPESEVLNLILEAGKAENQNKPYFLILDEMNLSHVERYFADFLSAMESGESIPLHSPYNWLDDVPSQIKLPKNLFIVGTVNIDETTYMFSPKVLDRANVIEFRVSKDEMVQYLENIKPLNLEDINGQGKDMAALFVELANDKSIKPLNSDNLNTTLLDFFKELKKTGAEFGYRSASEIHRFVAVANLLDPTWEMDEIIDCSTMQKLLPKVHGSRRKLEPVLKTLGTLCLADGQKIEEIFNRKTEIDFNDKSISKYPVSLEKIDRMYHRLIENGFTSYAEA